MLAPVSENDKGGALNIDFTDALRSAGSTSCAAGFASWKTHPVKLDQERTDVGPRK
jgi:hypothetical protein